MRERRILITGVSGFTGRHLAARLRRQKGTTLVGLDRAPSPADLVDLHFQADLADPEAVDRAVRQADPDLVFHLAGLFEAASERELTRVNIGGFVRLLNALRRHRQDRPVRVLAIGSSAEIGSARRVRSPVAENVDCRPNTPFGRTKWMATLLAENEPAESPLGIVVARAFHLVGPGLGAELPLGDLARQVAAVARGEAEAVQCGWLDARVDLLDVRDAVEAYLLLAEQGQARQLYNVCQGSPYRMGDLLDTLIELSGAEVPVHAAAAPPPSPALYGDNSKTYLETGWRPEIPIRQSLEDLLDSVT